MSDLFALHDACDNKLSNRIQQLASSYLNPQRELHGVNCTPIAVEDQIQQRFYWGSYVAAICRSRTNEPLGARIFPQRRSSKRQFLISDHVVALEYWSRGRRADTAAIIAVATDCCYAICCFIVWNSDCCSHNIKSEQIGLRYFDTAAAGDPGSRLVSACNYEHCAIYVTASTSALYIVHHMEANDTI